MKALLVGGPCDAEVHEFSRPWKTVWTPEGASVPYVKSSTFGDFIFYIYSEMSTREGIEQIMDRYVSASKNSEENEREHHKTQPIQCVHIHDGEELRELREWYEKHNPGDIPDRLQGEKPHGKE